jgi:hypothetical protein
MPRRCLGSKRRIASREPIQPGRANESEARARAGLVAGFSLRHALNLSLKLTGADVANRGPKEILFGH